MADYAHATLEFVEMPDRLVPFSQIPEHLKTLLTEVSLLSPAGARAIDVAGCALRYHAFYVDALSFNVEGLGDLVAYIEEQVADPTTSTPFEQAEASLLIFDEISDDLAITGASWTGKQEPKYEYDGTVAWFTPSLGYASAAANDDGSPILTVHELTGWIDEVDSLDALRAKVDEHTCRPWRDYFDRFYHPETA